MKEFSHYLNPIRRVLGIAFIAIFVGVLFGCGGGGGGSSSGGDGGTPPPPANVPPVANAGSDQQVNEGSAVTLNGSGTDSDGTVTGFSWTQTVGPTVTLTGANTAAPSFTAPAVTAQTVLTFALTVTDNLGAPSTNADTVNVTVDLAGLLSVTTSVPPAARVDLTAEGTLDWAHWGLTGNTSFEHKNIPQPLISNYTEVPNPTAVGGPFRFTDAPVAYSWSDGIAPSTTAVDTTTGIYFITDVDEGYSLTVPADTTPTTLKIYLGGLSAEGRLTATLSDGSAGPVEVLMASQSETDGFARVATITFKALSAGQTLTLEYVLNDDFGTPSNLTLQAATLASVAKPTITPPGGVFTDSVNVTLSSAIPGAEIRYTTDGSDPTSTSTLYAAPFSVASTQTAKARVFVAGLAGEVASADFTVNASVSGGSLSAFVDVPAAAVDLTVEGTLDWAHWGLTGNTSFEHKNIAQPLISNYTEVPNAIAVGGPFQFTDAPVAYSWSDGIAPSTTALNTTTGIYFITGVDEGYSLTVSADTTPKTLKIYLGGLAGEGRLTASLSDGSATDATLLMSNEFGVFARVVTITFSAASGSQTLTVNYTLSDDFGTPSNLTLQAATLR